MDKTYLIVDKFSTCDGVCDESFTNENTKKYTVEYLFSSEIPYKTGKQALKKYNTYKLHKIDDKILSHKLYEINYFEINDKKITIHVLLLCVDNNLMKVCYENKNIPEEDILKQACIQDRLYNNGYTKEMGDVKKDDEKKINLREIEVNAMKPNSDPTDPILKTPEYTKLDLFLYQKRTIEWMRSRELQQTKICIEENDLVMGDIVYDKMRRKFYDINEREYVEFYGGALIDEVGLGKTFQTIVAALENRVKKEDWEEVKKLNKVESKATLIICPNQLAGQWEREIKNVIETSYGIKTIAFLTKAHYNKYTYKELFEADFVITTFNYVMNDCFIEQIGTIACGSVSSYVKNGCSMSTTKTAIQKIKQNFIADYNKKINDKQACLLSIDWRRIVIDEFHELLTIQKYQFVRNIIEAFTSKYRWCLTGTPFSIKDESKSSTSSSKSVHHTSINRDEATVDMFNFVTKYKYDARLDRDNIWLNKQITNYMKSYFFRRNTKHSVADENKLPPLKEVLIKLNFSNTEKLMYNSKIKNAHANRFSECVRQLCCHPQISDEFKAEISDCESLQDIEKVMLRVYKTAAETAENIKNECEYKLKMEKIKLQITEWKRYGRTLLSIRDEKDQKESKYIVKYIRNAGMVELHEKVQHQMFQFSSSNSNENGDEDDENNKKKEEITIKEDNIDEIKKIIQNYKETKGKRIGFDMAEKYGYHEDIETNIIKINEELAKKTDEYKDAKSTYNYYLDMMKKVKELLERESDETDSEDDEIMDKCGVCCTNIVSTDIGMTKCGHVFCYNCVKPFVNANKKCPFPKCNIVTDVSEIYMVVRNKNNDETQEEFNEKQKLISKVGTKIANLIFFLKKHDKNVIIFSQWDDMLKRVGKILTSYDIKNVFCEGNVFQRDCAIRNFSSDNKVKVIMLSAKVAAAGANLTKAEMVIFLDPIYGTYENKRNIEWQAIGRAHRTGQKKQVKVVRFIIENTVEEEIYNMHKNATEEEKNKYNDNEIIDETVDEIDESEIKLSEDDTKSLAEKIDIVVIPSPVKKVPKRIIKKV